MNWSSLENKIIFSIIRESKANCMILLLSDCIADLECVIKTFRQTVYFLCFSIQVGRGCACSLLAK